MTSNTATEWGVERKKWRDETTIPLAFAHKVQYNKYDKIIPQWAPHQSLIPKKPGVRCWPLFFFLSVTLWVGHAPLLLGKIFRVVRGVKSFQTWFPHIVRLERIELAPRLIVNLKHSVLFIFLKRTHFALHLKFAQRRRQMPTPISLGLSRP